MILNKRYDSLEFRGLFTMYHSQNPLTLYKNSCRCIISYVRYRQNFKDIIFPNQNVKQFKKKKEIVSSYFVLKREVTGNQDLKKKSLKIKIRTVVKTTLYEKKKKIFIKFVR